VFRCLLALVALFYVVQHVSAVAHFALVRHAVCEEHGELVDIGATTSLSPATEHSREVDQGSRESSPSTHDHEHCGVLAHLRQQLAPSVSAGVSARVVAVAEVEIVFGPSAAPLATPVYCIAPKNSPPA